MEKAHAASHFLRSIGPNWAIERARGVVRGKTGSAQRILPSRPWKEFIDEQVVHDLEGKTLFTGDLSAIGEGIKTRWTEKHLATLQADYNALMRGQMRFYSGQLRSTNWPPSWHPDPSGLDANSPRRHFSTISHFPSGDIKDRWEPGRFSSSFTLANAYAAGFAENAPLDFFALLDDFVEKNPPFTGMQWMCGQETALRILAIASVWPIFELEASDRDYENFSKLLIASGHRIFAFHDYALSQKNNHGISEAVGLLVIAAFAPSYEAAPKWQKLGEKSLEDLANTLVDADGGFSQQSANYHRLAMHLFITGLRAGSALNAQLPASRHALRKMVSFAEKMLVTEGRQPRYGHDDGALLFPFSPCSYDDFRPVVQEAAFEIGRPLPYGKGPWDSGLDWLGANMNLVTREDAPQVERQTFPAAGFKLLRAKDLTVSMRLPPGTFRPGQADAMHVDIWRKNQNIALDPGTYRYNANGVWASIPLSEEALHNTISPVDNPTTLHLGRFIFAPWQQTVMIDDSSPGSISGCFKPAMGPINEWTRTVSAKRGTVVVSDEIRCKRQTELALTWQLADGSVINKTEREFFWQCEDFASRLSIESDTPGGVSSAYRAGEDAKGWFAPRYGERRPCHTVIFKFNTGKKPILTLKSVFSFADEKTEVDAE